MVAHGTLIGFLGDWLEHMHLCICLPSKNMLLTSDTIPNLLVLNESIMFSEEDCDKIVESSREAIFKKFDNGDHPWLSPQGTTVLDIMASATLTALQLVCKGDLFVKCSVDHPAREHLKQADKAWRETVKQHEERRRRNLQVIKNRLSSKFSKNGGNGPSQNKDDDKDPASGGNGPSFLVPPFFCFLPSLADFLP